MSSVSPGHHLDVAARMLSDLDGQRRRETRSYTDGYHDGHHTGFDLGYAQAERDMAQAWHAVAAAVRPQGHGIIGRTPPRSLAELQRIRDQPGGAAYLDRLARHGGHEYEGGPVQWEPGRPLRRTA